MFFTMPNLGVLLLCFIFAKVLCSNEEELNKRRADKIINTVNEARTTWKAGYNFHPKTSRSYFKKLAGAIIDKKLKAPANELINNLYEVAELPTEFDARKQWSHCKSISHIFDQGNCGSCWSVSAANAFTDRICIATNETKNPHASPQYLTSCCSECGSGCFGGNIDEAWKYLRVHGIVTGGDYNTTDGCQPYLVEPCEHHTKGSLPSCDKTPEAATPQCKSFCYNKDYIKSLDDDIVKAKSYYSLEGQMNAMRDIYANGPIQAAFLVHEDFVHYKSGVYQQVTGSFLGGHAVRIIGWGVENKTPYWLVANSWNNDWGDNGTFKILRGKNECQIESDLVAGLPDVRSL